MDQHVDERDMVGSEALGVGLRIGEIPGSGAIAAGLLANQLRNGMDEIDAVRRRYPEIALAVGIQLPDGSFSGGLGVEARHLSLRFQRLVIERQVFRLQQQILDLLLAALDERLLQLRQRDGGEAKHPVLRCVRGSRSSGCAAAKLAGY